MARRSATLLPMPPPVAALDMACSVGPAFGGVYVDWNARPPQTSPAIAGMMATRRRRHRRAPAPEGREEPTVLVRIPNESLTLLFSDTIAEPVVVADKVEAASAPKRA